MAESALVSDFTLLGQILFELGWSLRYVKTTQISVYFYLPVAIAKIATRVHSGNVGF